jgi:ABC-2 type transport system ATP-binding protein
MSMVEIQHLSVNYGTLRAVKSISFQIPKGGIFGFIGPNGAGKSSTIKVLATLQEPSAGVAKIDGVNVSQFPHVVRSQVGYVPDFFGVYEDLTVREYLYFFAAAFRLDRDKRDVVVRDVLVLTDLTDKQESQVDSLSRGMKQRLSMARVLLHDPQVLLLDEPASGLDPRARIEMRELLKELKRMGKTILISSHILQELAHLCTHIGIIEAGQMVAQGSVSDIMQHLGAMRMVHVQVTGTSNGCGAVELLKAIPGVVSVRDDTDRLAVHIREEIVEAEDLLIAMHERGIRVRMFQPEALDMETAFMKLTQGKVA